MSMRQLSDAGIILLLALAILIPQLAGYPLLEPDEARYVEIPREMLVTGDYVIPRLNSIIYLEKPPFFYWLQTLSIRAFGIEEMALRFWNAFFAAFSCVMIYIAGSTLYNRRTGWLAAGLLFSSLLYFAMAHFITLDMTLSGLVSACLFSIIIALNQASPINTRLWFYAAYGFAALALLTKGLIGILLPGSVFILWILATQQWSALKRAHIPTGLVIFMAIALPWHLMAQMRVEEFFDFYIIGQHFRRYLTLAEKRYQPVWFFAVILFAGLIPWVFFTAQAFIRQCSQIRFSFKKYPTETYLILWAGFIFVFFSLSKSKLVPYILPVIPPLMLLLSHDLLSYTRKKWEWIATLTLIPIAAICLFLFPTVAAPYFDPYLLNHHRIVLYEMGTVLVLTLALCVYFLMKHRMAATFAALAAGSLLVFSAAVPLSMQLADRSIKPLAMIIEARTGEYDEIIGYQRYFPDLPVYTEQIVTVVDRRGELAFGMMLEDHSDHMITRKEFWERWNRPGYRVFALMGHKHFDKDFAEDPRVHVLGKTSRYVLISNHGGENS